NPRRMADLPVRAKRAGIEVTLTDRPETLAPFDLVLVDAPCSGSGSWRRDPEGKWKITKQGLEEVVKIQREIQDRAALLVRSGGWLGYATCSLLDRENRHQADAFLKRHPGWTQERELRLTPVQGGDGFYLALFRHG
ncbi:MAG: RsmB/NOP family class I SAM-dependent RNA methyltransferase, partial [Acetobacteraceae bacterium]